ncbi:MAG TPA: PTS IIA-like nitrogen-regulatory protein PtsN [Halieaceae bacterium]|jgi:PTS system nitrogen regulatory IIA component|uniref:PTS IIA-like nitrogen regulatory protein PtsN n=1 Tax=Haliea TaxID=475794 RepID=UPI000401F873|nr:MULTISPECIES: PTS IIA-like nitrogen regulatory protein PtsN [Haliea]HAN68173.1 PTS IIA-like nitrogen-regulatory protein PtsN [Halieaceae bacterium]MAY93815.1 PTS IIA-like nitrogen-regulatory protein PtsN [Haliea sp.]MBK41574.1 PTS IIA-like nitrogen-regulatory protein PtsN [Haliea sp.]MBP70837.1 PTS IIA-like nitrogen-regulatory protein PtsN [Haliea sp.]HBM82401.1 PTS IIA-like nitrogen-regulatory protein PtsN [Halieaceae bacterium]|tara:strand:- start:25915 stop:26373 length:459 start_codon:yes stop_codon:yes gene_type:complete
MHVLSELLTPGRTVCRAPGSSKKRLFETLASVVSEDSPGITEADIFAQLIARERLGSTGLGAGIAIPHCRIANCNQPIGCLVTLEEPIDFDAPDDLPVDILFVLLVPEEAHQTHLEILARIARLFSQSSFCEALRDAPDSRVLFQRATEWQA